MKIYAFCSETYETMIVNALTIGGLRHGVRIEKVSIDFQKRPVADGVILISMTNNRKPIHDFYRERGVPVICIDKGYVRQVDVNYKSRFWRVSVNDLQPTAYLDQLEPDLDRWSQTGQPLLPYHEGEHVLVAGSTDRYHNWHGLPPPDEWARQVCEEVRRYWSGPILWRPKPSTIRRGRAFSVPGTVMDIGKGSLERSLAGARLLVTHGSGIGCDAIWAGTPVVSLARSVFSGVSAPTIRDGLEKVRFPQPEERMEWCGRIARVQYTIQEMQKGMVWDYLKAVLTLLSK